MSSSSPVAEIAPLVRSAAVEAELAGMLVEVVAAGGSVHFMHPLALDDARAYWTKALDAAARGERVMLGAWVDGALAATVSLQLDTPPNQPHRAEIAKMMTRPAFRRRGLARDLLIEAERLAAQAGRTLLVLDTAEDDGGAPLYETQGYHLAGRIPDYAFKPHGGLTGTLIYWKRL
jgi:ribosomal protein S18 acetylase RimI-like enzyme